MIDKIINWVLSLYLKSIISRVGGIEEFTSMLKNIDSVLVDENKSTTTIRKPSEKWSITIKTNPKDYPKGSPPRKL